AVEHPPAVIEHAPPEATSIQTALEHEVIPLNHQNHPADTHASIASHPTSEAGIPGGCIATTEHPTSPPQITFLTQPARSPPNDALVPQQPLGATPCTPGSDKSYSGPTSPPFMIPPADAMPAPFTSASLEVSPAVNSLSQVERREPDVGLRGQSEESPANARRYLCNTCGRWDPQYMRLDAH
ncbi:hypothetical protein AURDEDRAFT_171058, partial [Auricularia subglabra TFB-10046 SS5]